MDWIRIRIWAEFCMTCDSLLLVPEPFGHSQPLDRRFFTKKKKKKTSNFCWTRLVQVSKRNLIMHLYKTMVPRYIMFGKQSGRPSNLKWHAEVIIEAVATPIIASLWLKHLNSLNRREIKWRLQSFLFCSSGEHHLVVTLKAYLNLNYWKLPAHIYPGPGWCEFPNIACAWWDIAELPCTP